MLIAQQMLAARQGGARGRLGRAQLRRLACARGAVAQHRQRLAQRLRKRAAPILAQNEDRREQPYGEQAPGKGQSALERTRKR